MLEITNGGMSGHIGRYVWFCGSDLHPDAYANTLETSGFNRFGSTAWWPTNCWGFARGLFRFHFY